MYSHTSPPCSQSLSKRYVWFTAHGHTLLLVTKVLSQVTCPSRRTREQLSRIDRLSKGARSLRHYSDTLWDHFRWGERVSLIESTLCLTFRNKEAGSLVMCIFLVFGRTLVNLCGRLVDLFTSHLLTEGISHFKIISGEGSPGSGVDTASEPFSLTSYERKETEKFYLVNFVTIV